MSMGVVQQTGLSLVILDVYGRDKSLTKATINLVKKRYFLGRGGNGGGERVQGCVLVLIQASELINKLNKKVKIMGRHAL
jgi:hypothetical protein